MHFTTSHSVLLWNSHLTLFHKSGVSRECLYPFPTPKFGLTATVYFFQINKDVYKVQDPMPWSFSWPSSRVSTLRGLPPWWWFPSLHLQPQLKQPSAFRLPSLCVFTSTSNMCKKSFLSSSHEITLLLGFLTPLVAQDVGTYVLPFTFIPHSSLI